MSIIDHDPYSYHPLENIEEVDIFNDAIERKALTKKISEERPYTYWTIELYDQQNGIRGGGGLGILAADTRRVAENMGVPFALITPFYPYETHQVIENGKLVDKHLPVDYKKFGFKRIDQVFVKCCGNLCALDVVEKAFRSTRIIGITEPNFGELYQGLSGSDHRLYQEVSLGFGGYAALKLLGLKPAIMQLNEVATFFAALARLDELAGNGMDFYEAMVYTRKHTLYTNHTLVQAAEAEFSYEQFERFVFPNLKSLAVKKWLSNNFTDGKIKLSSVTIEIAEMRSGVSKLHARVANYHDLAGNKVKFKAITNGVDLKFWTLPRLLEFYQNNGILDPTLLPTADYTEKLEILSSEIIRKIKLLGRREMNRILKKYPDYHGQILEFKDDDLIYDFRRRLVDYKRPDMPFRDPKRFRQVLEKHNAYYILAGRVHSGDKTMSDKLQMIFDTIEHDDYLKGHVFYLPDYNEELAYALSVGSNVTINIPIVGLEACGTSWMKDASNLNLLISTHDGGVADGPMSAYLNVSGENELEELDAVYNQMENAAQIWENDFDLEYTTRRTLGAFLPVISGTRMMHDYLDYLFPM